MDWRHVEQVMAMRPRRLLRAQKSLLLEQGQWRDGVVLSLQQELVFRLQAGLRRAPQHVQLGRFGRYRTNVWHYPGVNSFVRSSEGNLSALHPTVKPMAMVADAMLDCSARGDIVLDGFLGSGTTVIAAERTGRRCYGLELDPGYVDTIIRRWRN